MRNSLCHRPNRDESSLHGVEGQVQQAMSALTLHPLFSERTAEKKQVSSDVNRVASSRWLRSQQYAADVIARAAMAARTGAELVHSHLAGAHDTSIPRCAFSVTCRCVDWIVKMEFMFIVCFPSSYFSRFFIDLGCPGRRHWFVCDSALRFK